MADSRRLDEVLAGGRVDDAVFALRPDYRALLPAVDGLVPGPSDSTSGALLQAAETSAQEALGDRPVERLPTSLPGGRHTGRSARNRNAPATPWRPCCVGRRMGCPG